MIIPIRVLLVLALSMVTLEVLTGTTRDPLPSVVRSSASPIAGETAPPLDPTPVPSPAVTPTPPPPESGSPSPSASPASCFEIGPPLLVACPGDRVALGGWSLTLPEGWAAITPDAEFLPSLFGAGTEAGPFLNELGARSTARGISAVVMGRSVKPIEGLSLGSAEAVRTLLAARYPDRSVLVNGYLRRPDGRVFVTGSLTRDGLASRFLILAVPETKVFTRLAFAWAPWTTLEELYAVIGAE